MLSGRSTTRFGVTQRWAEPSRCVPRVGSAMGTPKEKPPKSGGGCSAWPRALRCLDPFPSPGGGRKVVWGHAGKASTGNPNHDRGSPALILWAWGEVFSLQGFPVLPNPIPRGVSCGHPRCALTVAWGLLRISPAPPAHPETPGAARRSPRHQRYGGRN